jgi:hypothetical protein
MTAVVLARRAALSAFVLPLAVLPWVCDTSLVATPPVGQPPTIVVNPSVSYQTMAGWEAHAQSGETDSPHFESYKATLFDQAVNDLGISRLRLEFTAKGSCAPGSADWAGTDNEAEKVVTPMRALALGAGKPFTVVLSFVPFSIGTCSANDYANLVHATFARLQSRRGWVPDALEIANEPDNAQQAFGGTLMGEAIVAASDRLAASGWKPPIIAPSGSHINASLTYFAYLSAVPGALSRLSMFGYHRYGDPSEIDKIAEQAIKHGKQTGMLEFIGGDHNVLYEDLTRGRVSAWQQYTLAFPTEDNGAQYYVVSKTGTLTLGARTRFLRQYFRSIRPGARRIGATGTELFAPVAFINADGSYVVVVKASSSGPFMVQGLPPGTYRSYWTTANQTDVQAPAVTIAAGQMVTGNIPATGVWTIVGTAGSSGSPTPGPGGSGADTTPPSISIARILQTGAELRAAVDAADDVGVVRVELYVDGSLVTTRTAPPYGFQLKLSDFPIGTHRIVAKAVDASGNAAESAAVEWVRRPPPAGDKLIRRDRSADR